MTPAVAHNTGKIATETADETNHIPLHGDRAVPERTKFIFFRDREHHVQVIFA